MVEDIIRQELDGKSFETAVVKPSEVEFLEHVREACRANCCGRYGKSWSCPPALGGLNEMQKRYMAYEKAFIFTTCTPLEDCYDIEGMTEARITHTALTDQVISALKEKNADFLPLGAGSCSICGECTYPNSPCRFPDKMYPSVESVGIDVVRLSKTANIHYINGEATVTYFSLIFFND